MRPASHAVLALVATSCAAPDPSLPRHTGDVAAADPARPPAEADAGTLVQLIYDYGLGFGETRAAIVEALGEPSRTDTALAENRHVPSAMDSLFTLHYDGLRFELNRPGPVDRELLISVTLSDPGRELPGGIGVGTPRSELTRLLDAPYETRAAGRGTGLAYRAPGTEVDQFVEFVVEADTVRQVRWAPYVD